MQKRKAGRPPKEERVDVAAAIEGIWVLLDALHRYGLWDRKVGAPDIEFQEPLGRSKQLLHAFNKLIVELGNFGIPTDEQKKERHIQSVLPLVIYLKEPLVEIYRARKGVDCAEPDSEMQCRKRIRLLMKNFFREYRSLNLGNNFYEIISARIRQLTESFVIRDTELARMRGPAEEVILRIGKEFGLGTKRTVEALLKRNLAFNYSAYEPREYRLDALYFFLKWSGCTEKSSLAARTELAKESFFNFKSSDGMKQFLISTPKIKVDKS